MALAGLDLSPARGARLSRLRPWLVALMLAAALLSVATGAAGVSVSGILSDWLAGAGIAPRDRVVLFDIRLPRLAMGLIVGAALAVAGAVMQGLFRNPLADPGVIGVTAGASLGAVVAIVLGGLLPGTIVVIAGPFLVPAAAFAGAWATMALLYGIARQGGQTHIATLLLAGIALTALAFALTGTLTFLADDRQLRDLTFWQMGSLAGASWPKLATGALLILPVLALAPRLAEGLNALSLGEAAAAHMGADVERLKRFSIVAVAALAGASVALSGAIGFVGIVVPHLLRLVNGPDHRPLLIDAALLGAALVVLADLIARRIVSPAELPIGIVTAVIGAPVFLWILLRRRGVAGA